MEPLGDKLGQAPPSQAAASSSGIARVGAPAAMTIPERPNAQTIRKAQLQLDVLSPVNPSGCFEFDRVIKSGRVLKRTRKTKSWKPVFLVLRPNCLSIYRDDEATKLRHQITLSDLTAVARQKDPKRKAKHVFGLFSPARNFHIEAYSEEEAQDWVEKIRREARFDEEEEEMILMSPGGYNAEQHDGFRTFSATTVSAEARHIGSSSSEHEGPPATVSRPKYGNSSASPENKLHSARRPSNALANYSGNEHGSYSDFSETGFFPDSSLSLAQHSNDRDTSGGTGADAIYRPHRPSASRKISGISLMAVAAAAQQQDSERVIYHGWLYLLKSKRGVRQWKSVWCVLRPKALALYKNEDEYAALLVLPFPQILNAVELDAQSRSKKHCFQLITEDRNLRFCASGEDELDKWLGALKSLLAKRKERALAAARESSTKGKQGTEAPAGTKAPPPPTTATVAPVTPIPLNTALQPSSEQHASPPKR